MTQETVKAVFKRYEMETVLNEEGKEVQQKVTPAVVVETVSGSVPFDFGKDLDELIEIFDMDRELIYYHAVSSLRVGLQNWIRGSLAQGATQEKMLEDVKKWDPPTGKPRGKSKIDRVKELLSKLSPEEREAILAGDDPEEGDEGVDVE